MRYQTVTKAGIYKALKNWGFCACYFWNPVTPSIGEGNGTPPQYSCLENPMDGGAWWAAVHGVAESQTRLSDFPFTFHFHALEKEMTAHSSVLAWRIPGMGEPGGLPSMGSHRVGYDWSDLAAAAAAATASMWTSPDKPIQWSDIGWWETHNQCLWIMRPAKQVSKALEH